MSHFETIIGNFFIFFITFWTPFCHPTQLLVTCLSQFHLLVTQHQTTRHDTIAHNTTQDNTTHHNTSTSRHKATQGTTNSWLPCCSKTMQDRSFLNANLGEGGVIQRCGTPLIVGLTPLRSNPRSPKAWFWSLFVMSCHVTFCDHF